MGEQVALDLVRPDTDRRVQAFDALPGKAAAQRCVGWRGPEQGRGEQPGRSEQADAGGREFCREWEAVYAALRDGPLVAAETRLDLFLAKYPADSVARYHRSIYDDADAMSRSSGQKSKPALLGRERG